VNTFSVPAVNEIIAVEAAITAAVSFFKIIMFTCHSSDLQHLTA
jgi:hypothetical protein